VTSNPVRVAIILLASTDRKLDGSEVDLNKKLIKGHSLDFVKGSNAPVLKASLRGMVQLFSTLHMKRPVNGQISTGRLIACLE
jgi:hypothetical protein